MASCECGCGEEVAEGKRYVRGHHLRKGARGSDRGVIHASSQSLELPSEILLRPLNVHITPFFRGEDKGDGGIRRVWEAQVKHLPKYGINVVDTAEEADVIAYHATVPENYVKLYPNKPFVAMCHGLYWAEYDWGNWSYKANADVMEGIRVSDAVIACSEWVANSIRRNSSRDTRVIYHGIDIEDWNGHETVPYVLWNKTRPDPICDPDPLNQLVKAMPDVQFVSTFGDEADNVKLTGKLPFEDAKELIQRAGVYLCTSRETFGIGTLEALASGVPVVGFNWGGQSEFIEHGVDGWLVKPGDITGLTTGVKWALAHREEISANCRKKAEQFSWERACEQYAEIFNQAFRKNIQARVPSTPRTSIVVTNYNLHEYLTDCLKSVQNQTDQDWECIVVDDASPDATGKFIAQTFADEDHRFIIIRNETNQYLAEARNIGIRSARGRYILPLDADDMLDPNAVKMLAESLDADRSIHVAYGNVYFVNEDGVTPTDYGVRGKSPGFSSWPFQFSFEQQIMQRNLLPYCSMFRKEAWRQTGGYRRRCRTAEDADLWVRLSSYGFRPKMVTEAKTLIYRNREGSMSRVNSTDWVKWFTWSRVPAITPSGAVTEKQLPVLSVDPILISVIIPVGPGHEKLFTDAIDSVDAQTFRNWECIVINDTGNEFLGEMPSWVRLLQTEGKTGPAKARNTGIAASRGALFLPLDADDYLEPQALEIMYDAYRERQAEVIYSDFWQTRVQDPSEIIRHECDDYDPAYLKGNSRVVDGVKREGMIHSVTALTPKKRWEQVGGYDENIPGWEDWDFQLALGNVGVCSRRVAYPLFTYRMHTGLRREENIGFFERSKEGIIKKWGALWEGGKEMACGACRKGGGTTYYPSSSVAKMGVSRPGADPGGAKLVHYSGSKAAAISYRGRSGTVYWFSSTDADKYVLEQDMPIFQNHPEFSVIQPVIPIPEPELVAEGAPIW